MEMVIRLPRPLPHQLPVLVNPKRFKMIVCGRRWSKTGLSLIASIQGHGEYPGQRKGAAQGGNIAWIGKTTKQAKKDWRQLKRACKDAWIEKSEVDREIVLPGSGKVAIWSAEEPDNIRGDGLDGVILNEGAFFPNGEYLWNNVLRPSLMDNGGWAIFATTPNGLNWLKDLFDLVPGLDEWERWQQPTSANPLIPLAELAEIKRSTPPSDYQQEYEARFVKREGVEWPAEYFTDSIWYDGEPPTEYLVKVMALDPSLGQTDKSDYSAFVMGTVLHNGEIWIDADIRRRDVEQIAQDGLSLCQRFQPDCWGCEVNGFQALDALIRKCAEARRMYPRLARVTQSSKKLPRIRLGVGPALATGRLKFKRNSPGAALLVAQLKDFPQGDHDDGPDALETLIRIADELIATGGLPKGVDMTPQRVYA
jgi:phage terminase large subunit-like protein